MTPDRLASLHAAIDRALTPLLPPGTRCALLGFPLHANVGDHAIWLGETTWLRRHGIQLVEACDAARYSRDRVRSRLGPSGIVLLHGGGNFGDLWPDGQAFRETVLADFLNHPVIQLPQSIHFRTRRALARARAVVNRHPRLTLLVRDHHSLALARRAFAAASRLCPDMAFALGPLARSGRADIPIVWLARRDHESRGIPRLRSRAVRVVDWVPRRSRPSAVAAWLSRQSRRCQAPAIPDLQTYDAAARRRLAKGCRLLSRGQVVITDRLHGHIVSLLLAIPHVLLDTREGKVGHFVETWTEGEALVRWARSPAVALRLARAWVTRGRCSRSGAELRRGECAEPWRPGPLWVDRRASHDAAGRARVVVGGWRGSG